MINMKRAVLCQENVYFENDRTDHDKREMKIFVLRSPYNVDDA